MSNTTTIYNPDTPLAFLHPNEATQLEIYRYCSVATLGAFTWNTFSHVDTHYKLLFRSPVNMSTLAYFVSIVSTAIYIIGCVVFHVGSIPNCQTVATTIAAAYAVAIPSTLLLFLFRIFAVFNGEPIIRYLFVLLWAAVLGCAMSFPFALFGTHIGPTTHCTDSGVKPFSSAPIVASTVYDSLVFIFISYRLLNGAFTGQGWRDKLKAFYGGGALPVLSKGLLQSGQVYYLITIFANIATTVVILSPSVPVLLHAVLTVPNSALTNSMACKVFRDVKFGVQAQTGSSNVPWRINNHRDSTMAPNFPIIKVEKETYISYGYLSDIASHQDNVSLESQSEGVTSSPQSARESQVYEV